MTIEITTERLRLRPLMMADAPVLQDLVFNDAEVVKWLAHDISIPGNSEAFARGWCNKLGVDGDNTLWSRGSFGAFAITDRRGEFTAQGALLGIVGFYCAEKIDGKWNGEFFYALGKAFQRQGIMTEACECAIDAYCKLPDSGGLYAVYWHTLNPVSGRILAKLGFKEVGVKRVVDEYGQRDALSFYQFELWRIESADDSNFSRIASEAATKIGHLAYEGLVSRKIALDSIEQTIAQHPSRHCLDSKIEAAFERGMQGAGLLHLNFARAA